MSSTSCKRERAQKSPEDGPQNGGTAVVEEDPDARTLNLRGPTHVGADMAGKEPRKRELVPPVTTRADALAAVSRGQPEAAIEALQRSLEKKPADLEARLGLARALIAVGRLDDADAVLADKKVTATAELVRQRARLALSRGRLDAARALLGPAITKWPDELSLRGQLVAVETAAGRAGTSEVKQQVSSLYDAFDAGKAKTAAQLLAVAYATLASGTGGGFKDANDVLSDAERLEPASGGTWLSDEIHLLHAEIFREKYAADEAAATYAMILERDPWHPEALNGLGAVMLDELRLADAARAAEEVLQVDSRNAPAHVTLAWVAVIEGRSIEARARLEEFGLQRDPTDPTALSVLAAAAIWQGDTTTATDAERRALTRHPGAPWFFVRLAELLATIHLYPETAEVTTRGLALSPKDPYILSAHGLNLLRLGREEEALAAIQAAWTKDRFNERTFNTRNLFRERIANEYMLDMHGAIELRLPKDTAALVLPELRAAATASVKTLDAAYRHPTAKLRLELFAEPEDFSIRTVGTPSLGALGVCFGPVVTLVGPYSGAFNFHQVLHHEIAHTYAISISAGRVPRWVTEGLSEWESELVDPAFARESAELLWSARDAGRLRKLGELDLAFLRAENPIMMEIAYATATYAVRWLGTTHGREKLIAIVADSRSGKPTSALLEKHLAKPIIELEREFDAWMTKELTSRISGYRPRLDSPDAKDPKQTAFVEASKAVADKQYDAAKTKVEALIAEGADGYLTRMLAAQVALARSDDATAKAHLQAAARFHREAVEPLAALADMARRQGDTDAELEALITAIGIDAMSFDPAARATIVAWAAKSPHFDRALDRALQIAPTHPLTMAALARRLAKKDAKRAATLLEAAERDARVQAGPPEIAASLALAARALGRGAVEETYKAVALAKQGLHPRVRAALEQP